MKYKIKNIEKDAKEKLLAITSEPEQLVLDYIDKNNEFQWFLINNTAQTTVSVFKLNIPEQNLYTISVVTKEEVSVVVLSDSDAENNPIMLELIKEHNLRS